MIIEDTVRGTDHGFAIALGIPSQPDAWLEVILVGLDAFLYSESVIGGERQALRRFEPWRKLNVVANPKVQGHSGADAPGVLPEHAQGFVGERVLWTADALNETRREARAISLHWI